MRIWVLRSDGKIQRYNVKSYHGYVKVGFYRGRVLWTTPENFENMKELEKREYERVKKEIEKSYREERVRIEPQKKLKKKRYIYRVYVRAKYSSPRGIAYSRNIEETYEIETDEMIERIDLEDLDVDDWIKELPWDEVDVGFELVRVEES